MRSWRVAVIGLGEAGREIHLPALADLRPAALAGVCDPDPERRSMTHGAPAYGKLEALLEEARPEVVVVATPPALHAEHAVACLEAGAHVILEKPVAGRLADVDRIADAARAAGRRVAPSHPFRWMAPFRAVLEAAREEGPVVFAQAWQLVDLPPEGEPGWRGRLAHRSLYEAGVHAVDLLVALFGGSPEAVGAAISPAGAEPGTDAVVAATLEFPGRRLAQLTQSRVHRGRTRYLELLADTAGASLRASHGGRVRLVAGLEGRRPVARLELGASGLAWRESGGRRRTLARAGRGDPRVTATRELIADALAAFGEDREPRVTLAEARAGLAAIAAAYRSAETGRRVALDEPELSTLDLAAER